MREGVTIRVVAQQVAQKADAEVKARVSLIGRVLAIISRVSPISRKDVVKLVKAAIRSRAHFAQAVKEVFSTKSVSKLAQIFRAVARVKAPALIVFLAETLHDIAPDLVTGAAVTAITAFENVNLFQAVALAIINHAAVQKVIHDEAIAAAIKDSTVKEFLPVSVLQKIREALF